MPNERQMRCRAHGKQSYPNQEAADAALAVIGENPGVSAVIPVRSYRADCGFWHLTSKDLRR